MFIKQNYDETLYSSQMAALKKMNEEYIALSKSKAYRRGYDIQQFAANIRKPKKILATIKNRIVYKNEANLVLNDQITEQRQSTYFSNARIAIYTAVFGMYDQIADPIWVPDNCDFYIITDCEMNEMTWKRVNISNEYKEEFEALNNKDKNRFCKFFPYKIDTIKDYDYCIYVDGNIRVITDLTEFIHLENEFGFWCHMHSTRTCVYTEAEYCDKLNLEQHEKITSYIKTLRREGFPQNYGLLECNVLVRNNTSRIMREIMEEWWRSYNTYLKRDQLTLPYVLYKMKILPSEIGVMGKNIYQNYAFRKMNHR